MHLLKKNRKKESDHRSGQLLSWWLMPSGSVGTSKFSHATCPSRIPVFCKP